MNIQSFLHFWSNHNDVIIQVLVALILFIVIFLAFRFFFGSEIVEGGVAAQVNTQDIEKTLQKILEAQAKAPATVIVEAGQEPLKGAGASSAANMAELEALKKDLAQKEQLLASAREDAARAAASVAAIPVVSPGTAEQAKKLEAKIKDLEARLAEYEIISEDIADLSFYKEENIRLQNELANLKNIPSAGGGAAAPVASPSVGTKSESSVDNAASSGTPAAAKNPGSVTNFGAGENSASSPLPEPDSLDSLLAEAEALQPSSAAPQDAPAPAAVEDDIMKEFAQAVEDQKPLIDPPPPAKTDAQENTDLMNQFENFVKKS